MGVADIDPVEEVRAADRGLIGPHKELAFYSEWVTLRSVVA